MSDAIFQRKKWTKKGIRPIVLTNGSHQKTVVFGALSHDGRQHFRQYAKFDQHSFLDHLKQLHKKFGRILLYADRAPQHRAKIVREYLEENKEVTLKLLPKGSPELNAVEEAWRQSKYDILVSQYQPSLKNLKETLAEYLRTRRFHLDIIKYLWREDG